jgi:hypothetical protein
LADHTSADSPLQTIDSILGGRRFIPWQQTGCSRGFLSEQHRKGNLRVVRLGYHTGVLLQDWLKFLDNLPTLSQDRSQKHQKAARERWRREREVRENPTPAAQ